MGFVKLTVLGYIPANTPCPYANECFAAHNDACFHRGADHDEEYNCHVARMMDHEMDPEEVLEPIVWEMY